MVSITYKYNKDQTSLKTMQAAWELFLDESIDLSLRKDILIKVLKISYSELELNKEFRPYQIDVNIGRSNSLICGREAYKNFGMMNHDCW